MTNKYNSEVSIRLANKSDLPFVVEIYNQAIKSKCATGDLTEFTAEQRIGWFAKFTSEQHPLYIAELAGKVVGYCSISPYRAGREAMETVAEISYYISYAYHKQGIGTQLVEYVLSDCKRTGKETLLAIVLDINPASISILKKLGFKKWGHFPDIINMGTRKCGHLVYGLKIDY